MSPDFQVFLFSGLRWLSDVESLVMNNLSWLLAQLDVAPLLPLVDAPQTNFSLDTQAKPRSSKVKGPLQAHDTIGGYYKFDHVSCELVH